MAAPTRSTIKTRVEAILDDIPSLGLLSGTETRIAASTLPLVEVRIGSTSYRKIAHKQRLATIRVHGWVVVDEIVHPDDPADVNAAIEAAYNWQDTIADYLQDRPRLERNDQGIAFGTGEEIVFSDPEQTPYKGGVYAAFTFTLDVIVLRV